MGTKDPRVDQYIKKSADFAKPILTLFRELVHQACPDVVETIKWGMPAFDYKGLMCGMAAFKQHCAIGFWKASILFAEETKSEKKSSMKSPKAAAGKKSSVNKDEVKDTKSLNWGAHGRDPIPAKITSIEQMPSKAAILRVIKAAKKLNDEGVKVVRESKKRLTIPMPKDFAALLGANAKALEVYNSFSPSAQREYLEWITEAKKEETRTKRIDITIQQLSEGKTRHWKYERC